LKEEIAIKRVGYFLLILFAGWLISLNTLPHAVYYFGMASKYYVLLGVFICFLKLQKKHHKGRVAENGIVTKKGEVPFSKIIRLERYCSELTSVIIPKDSYKVALSDNELVSLTRGHFPKMVIEGYNFTATRNERLSITYKPVNKYFIRPTSLIVIIPLMVGVTLFPFFFVFLLFVWIFSLFNKNGIKISLDDEGLHYQNQKDVTEQCLAFTQILKIKRNTHSILLYLNDGSVLKLPRFILLEEFIVEYAGLNSPDKGFLHRDIL